MGRIFGHKFYSEWTIKYNIGSGSRILKATSWNEYAQRMAHALGIAKSWEVNVVYNNFCQRCGQKREVKDE